MNITIILFLLLIVCFIFTIEIYFMKQRKALKDAEIIYDLNLKLLKRNKQLAEISIKNLEQERIIQMLAEAEVAREFPEEVTND